MHCSGCGNDNREGRKFCAHCGQPLKLACTSCGAPNEPEERFCGDCGASLADQAQAAAVQSPRAASNPPGIRAAREQAETSPALEGERKTVTALFADIKGSTELMRNLDPEEARAIVDPGAAAYDGRGASLRRLRCAIDRRRGLRLVWRRRRCRRGRNLWGRRCLSPRQAVLRHELTRMALRAFPLFTRHDTSYASTHR